MSSAPLVPCLYRTRIVHVRRSPVAHRFTYRGYCWYIDVDKPPRLPRGLGAFASFQARDHFWGDVDDTMRQRVDRFLASHGADLSGGTVTALLQARVLGHVFNPLSLYWCRDRDGTLVHVIAEVHNTYGGRHAYLLPPVANSAVAKRFYVSPFNDVDGRYHVRAPLPGDTLNISIALQRSGQQPFFAAVRGTRRNARIGELLRLQVIAPAAPLMGALAIRIEGVRLWLKGLPVVERTPEHERTKTA
ncbi:hypothetical protein BST43_18365 [Mycobacteroides saopaulense]|uniref:DUF1365 domain-containing protein n=1 Tax=Mycobacteroides saopaulense TaxID=1578165 RepID=A0A1S4VUW9_9MYCO|nr:DUF1365 domain-containing protein [Mycobacteroides saopaulense]ALR11703.1 hypothetical protein MYCSP_09780 [Mycobacteroides saopaulense]ORB53286.1 hypothetical protein BST43_18365 [Mycobacteroides saopaulense]